MANFIKRQKLSNHAANTSTKAVVFVRSFEHVDGNWPSHVYLNIFEGIRIIIKVFSCICAFICKYYTV